MKPAAVIFAEICLAGNAAAALHALPDAALERLVRHLQADSPSGSLAAIVLGLAELEVVERWLAETQDRAGAVGEGNL